MARNPTLVVQFAKGESCGIPFCPMQNEDLHEHYPWVIDEKTR